MVLAGRGNKGNESENPEGLKISKGPQISLPIAGVPKDFSNRNPKGEEIFRYRVPVMPGKFSLLFSRQLAFIYPSNPPRNNKEYPKESYSEMTPPQQGKSPLGRLVLFMVCLAVAGCIVAGAHYVVVDKPAQDALPAPANGDCPRYYSCQANCPLGYGNCCCCSALYNCGIGRCPDRCT